MGVIAADLSRSPLCSLLGDSGKAALGGRFADCERRFVVESRPSVLQAGPQEAGRTGIPDASMFCIAEARGFLPFFG